MHTITNKTETNEELLRCFCNSETKEKLLRYFYNPENKEWQSAVYEDINFVYDDIEENDETYIVITLKEDPEDEELNRLGRFMFYAEVNSTTKDYMAGMRKTLEEAQTEVLKYVRVAATNDFIDAIS